VKREFVDLAPDVPVPLSFVLEKLWPSLGFLPLDQENSNSAIIGEFMLNELILKNSDSLEKLSLKHLKELFESGEGEEDDDEEDEGYELTFMK